MKDLKLIDVDDLKISGSLYDVPVERVIELLKMQTELTRKETMKEFGIEEPFEGKILGVEKWAESVQKYVDTKLITKKS